MNIPNHVAIILDGNGRWAKKRMMPRQYGHAKGAQVVEQICEDAWNMGIQYLTVYAFSTENWNRPDSEVKILMDIFSKYMVDKLQKVGQKNMKIRFIGERSRLDKAMIEKIENLEESTKDNTGLNFTVALNYGRDGKGYAENGCRDKRRKTGTGRHYGRKIQYISGYGRTSGSGSADPYQRGTEIVELSALAACLYRILFYGCNVAGFQ